MTMKEQNRSDQLTHEQVEKMLKPDKFSWRPGELKRTDSADSSGTTGQTGQ